ncbi:hypothetical protein LINGRAHAP2_LOCUS31401 [Linum grandiflorum]
MGEPVTVREEGRPVTGFKEAVEECSLIGKLVHEYPFTWARARGKPHGEEERLDRGMVTWGWLELYPEAELHNIVVATSNHSALLFVYINL